jgi:hypothetical protein
MSRNVRQCHLIFYLTRRCEISGDTSNRYATKCKQSRSNSRIHSPPNICALQILRAIADDDESIWGSIRKLLRENDGRDTRSYLESLDRWDKRTIS